jgi:ABC-type glycerol-3-phosphate transport system permease component
VKKTAKLTFWNEGKVDWLIKVFLITLLVFAIAPFLVTINLSLKSVSQFEYDRWNITAPFEWANYKDAFKAVKVYIVNSIIISFLSAIGVVLLSAIGGYAFARGKFPLKEPIFVFIIAGLMIPGVLYLVPKFVLYRDFNLINTRCA